MHKRKQRKKISEKCLRNEKGYAIIAYANARHGCCEGKLHIWGRSSAGRAPHWQCGGHRFDPDRLHHIERLQTKSSQSFIF